MRVLVTGGAIGDLPIIRALKARGHYVITSGIDQEGPGHKESDLYVSCDYTNVDGLTEICLLQGVRAIIPSAHDLAAVAAAQVANKLNLPGYDSPDISEMIHNKDTLRESLQRCGVPQPLFQVLRKETDLEKCRNLRFPVIVKPVDLTGGNGISICRDFDALRRAFQYAFSISLSGRVIVEEFLVGTYHGFTTIITGGEVVWQFADNEHFLYDQFRVSATTWPSRMTELQLKEIRQHLNRFARHFKLGEGLLHAQVLVSNNQIYILEICRRTPGDLYPDFVSLCSGDFYIEGIINPFLGLQVEGRSQVLDVPNFNASVTRFVLMSHKRGVLDEIKYTYALRPSRQEIVTPPGTFIYAPRKTSVAIYFFEKCETFSDEDCCLMRDSIQAIVS